MRIHNVAEAVPRVTAPIHVQESWRGPLAGANVRAALRALRSNGLRSSLTLLGIVIGVAAVIAAATLTAGVGAGITQRFLTLGTNVVTISPANLTGSGVLVAGSSLTLDDAVTVGQLAHVTAFTPLQNGSGQVIYGNQNWRPHLIGVYPAYQAIQNWQLAEGSWFTSSDEQSALLNVVVGSTTAQNLFGPAGGDPLGKTIRIGGQLFHVVGTLQAKGINLDDAIFLPFSTFQQRLNNSPSLSQIQVRVDSPQNVAGVLQQVTALLEQRHHILPHMPDDFRVISALQFLQAEQAQAAQLSALFIGIAAISLTVGGIGIMNIMLVAVSERAREIGIRAAVGARRRDIRSQFLSEALLLSTAGGLAGVLLGLLVGGELTSAIALPLVINPLVILLAVACAALTGIVFGIYPAIRAACLDPIVALRRE